MMMTDLANEPVGIIVCDIYFLSLSERLFWAMMVHFDILKIIQ